MSQQDPGGDPKREGNPNRFERAHKDVDEEQSGERERDEGEDLVRGPLRVYIRITRLLLLE